MRTTAALIFMLALVVGAVYCLEFASDDSDDLSEGFFFFRRASHLLVAAMAALMIGVAFRADMRLAGRTEEEVQGFMLLMSASSFAVLTSLIYTFRKRRKDEEEEEPSSAGTAGTFKRIGAALLAVISFVSGILGIVAFYVDHIRQ